MPTQPETPPAFENPLMPNVRLRQLYLAMLRVRRLARALPRKRRGTYTPGLEACIAATSVDLTSTDIVSDTLTGGVIDFLRGAPLATVLNPTGKSRKRPLLADSGSASSLPSASSTPERLWAALGAAALLKIQAKGLAKDDAVKPSVGIAYVSATEVAEPVWRKLIAFATVHELPIIFVSLPPKSTGKPSTGVLSALALRNHMPGIAVDADDAVAIYRVAQESIGRARIGGGPALIECVPFILQSAKPTPASASDAIKNLERYMLHRQVVTQAWLDREAATLAKHLATS